MGLRSINSHELFLVLCRPCQEAGRADWQLLPGESLERLLAAAFLFASPAGSQQENLVSPSASLSVLCSQGQFLTLGEPHKHWLCIRLNFIATVFEVTFFHICSPLSNYKEIITCSYFWERISFWQWAEVRYLFLLLLPFVNFRGGCLCEFTEVSLKLGQKNVL